MQRPLITTMKPLITTITAIMMKPNDIQPPLLSIVSMHTGTRVKLTSTPRSDPLID